MFFLPIQYTNTNPEGKPLYPLHNSKESNYKEKLIDCQDPTTVTFEYVSNKTGEVKHLRATNIVANPLALADQNIVCFDIDMPLKRIEALYDDLYQILQSFFNLEVCYSKSKKQHTTFYIKVSDKIKRLIDSNPNLRDTTINKEANDHIEILHLSKKQLVFGLSYQSINHQDKYYTLSNSKNLHEEIDDDEIMNLLNFLQEHQSIQTPSTNNTKSSSDNVCTKFHSFLKRKSRKFRNISTEEAIGLATRKPREFYELLKEFDSDKYTITKGRANNAFAAIQVFFQGKYTSKKYYDDFVEFIESNIYKSDDKINHTYYNDMQDSALELPKYENKIKTQKYEYDLNNVDFWVGNMEILKRVDKKFNLIGVGFKKDHTKKIYVAFYWDSKTKDISTTNFNDFDRFCLYHLISPEGIDAELFPYIEIINEKPRSNEVKGLNFINPSHAYINKALYAKDTFINYNLFESGYDFKQYLDQKDNVFYKHLSFLFGKKIDYVLKLLSLSLFNNTKIKSILWINGKKDVGKTLFTRALREFVGNQVATTEGKLDENYSRDFNNKFFHIWDEPQITVGNIEQLKAWSGNDVVSLNLKFRDITQVDITNLLNIVTINGFSTLEINKMSRESIQAFCSRVVYCEVDSDQTANPIFSEEIDIFDYAMFLGNLLYGTYQKMVKDNEIQLFLKSYKDDFIDDQNLFLENITPNFPKFYLSKFVECIQEHNSNTGSGKSELIRDNEAFIKMTNITEEDSLFYKFFNPSTTKALRFIDFKEIVASIDPSLATKLKIRSYDKHGNLKGIILTQQEIRSLFNYS